MTPLGLLMVFFYWLFLSGVVFVAGAFVTRMFVTLPSGADFCMPAGRNKCLGESSAGVVLAVSVFALVAHSIHFVLHCSVVTEIPLSEVLPVLPVFATKTKFGRLALVRTVLLVAVIAAAFYCRKRNDARALAPGLLLSIAVLVSLSMSGHQGVKGYLRAPFFLDVFHILAASAWLGGLFFIRQNYSFILRAAGEEYWGIFLSLVNRFSRQATWGVAAVVLSGAGLALINLQSLSMVFSTPYGITLLVKVSTVILILVLGGANKFFLIPMLNAAGKATSARLGLLRKTLNVLVTAEMCLGLAVLLFTSYLTHLSPEG
jgi:putative copper resistance protein D